MARTAATIQADITVAETAYQAALTAQQVSQSGGGGAHAVTRQDIDKLYGHVQRLHAELARVQRGGIRVRRLTPNH